MRKILLGLLALAAAAPAIPTAAVAQDWRYDGYARDYRDGRYVQYDRRGDRDGRYDAYEQRGYGRYYDRRGYYHGPTWRGRDGRAYCRRSDGTTGLVVGGVAGALLGRTIDTRGDRAPGTLLGGAIGALLGQAIEKDDSRCR